MMLHQHVLPHNEDSVHSAEFMDADADASDAYEHWDEYDQEGDYYEDLFGGSLGCGRSHGGGGGGSGGGVYSSKHVRAKENRATAVKGPGPDAGRSKRKATKTKRQQKQGPKKSGVGA